jgi:predicted metal-binding membrane protein
MAMAASMAAMMVPTAAPFFFAYGRDSRRPAAVAITVVIYVAVWALVGALADLVMSSMMMPSSSVVAGAAVAFAFAYTVSPWSRRARARCREMCIRAPRGSSLRDALADGSTYAASCLACSAGVMVALVVVAMTNVLLIAVASVALLVYKVSDLGALAPGLSRGR